MTGRPGNLYLQEEDWKFLDDTASKYGIKRSNIVAKLIHGLRKNLKVSSQTLGSVLPAPSPSKESESITDPQRLGNSNTLYAPTVNTLDKIIENGVKLINYDGTEDRSIIDNVTLEQIETEVKPSVYIQDLGEEIKRPDRINDKTWQSKHINPILEELGTKAGIEWILTHFQLNNQEIDNHIQSKPCIT